MANDFWDINSTILRRDYPGLLESLGEKSDGRSLVIENTATGKPTLICGGFYIHSKRDPEREAQRLADTLEAGEGPVVALGFGLGYALEAVGGKFPGRLLIIVEKRSDVLKAAFASRDLSALLTKYRCIFICSGNAEAGTVSINAVSNALSDTLSLFREKPLILKNKPLVDLDKDWYDALEQRIQAVGSRSEVNRATARRFGKTWIRNLSHNLYGIRDYPGVNRLAGIFGGADPVPALLIAAGPSLDAVGPYLKELAERCVVIAVDTALRFVLSNGINPDFAVVVDPQYWNFRHLDRTLPEKTALIAESAVYPAVLRHPFDRIFLCSSMFPLGRFIEDRLEVKGQLGAGGSVATTAWDFARLLGTGKVFIAGLDLSFPGLKTHFRGALFEERSHAESNRFSPAETKSVHALRDGQSFYAASMTGGKVLTDRRLSLYAAWFENRFRANPNVSSKAILADRGGGISGLAIAGLGKSSVEEIMVLPPRRAEIDAILRGTYSRIDETFYREETKNANAAKYEAALLELLGGLEAIRGVAEKAARTAEKKAPGAALLDEANRFIAESKVRDVASLLLPDTEELEKRLTFPETKPYLRHLEFSSLFYRSLEETAVFHLKLLRVSAFGGKSGS
ncbi:hypothetical protein FACS1894151_03100 [Spirochaetia bacterium]|nr:hypothetical protein FACS1894151_03100 [Spirochaetia bacterium]